MALEELSFESVNGWAADRRMRDGWMDDGQKVITIVHPEHSSGELTIIKIIMIIMNNNHNNDIINNNNILINIIN